MNFTPCGGAWSDTISYINLENGVTQIEYYYPHCYSEDATPEIRIGENFTILEEISLFDFIIEENWIKEEYEVNEIIAFFNEKVKDRLKENQEENKRTLTINPENEKE